MRSRSKRTARAGFTLVEVLVALAAMALLATLSWQALDGMRRSREAGRAAVDRTVRLATVLTQWEQDLEAVVDTGVVPALAFDGQTLRLTRRVDEGVALIAWAVRGGVWQRWAGPAFVRAPDLQEGWLRSQQLLGNEPAQVALLGGASQWQLYYYRGNAWTNAQSTGNLVAAPSAVPPASAASGVVPTPVMLRDQPPDAVRLVITIDEATLTRDIALGPTGTP